MAINKQRIEEFEKNIKIQFLVKYMKQDQSNLKQ